MVLSEMYKIEKADKKHYEGLFALIQMLSTDQGLQNIFEAPNLQKKENIFWEFDNHRLFRYVLVCNELVVGYIEIFAADDKEESAYLNNLIIHPKYRGLGIIYFFAFALEEILKYKVKRLITLVEFSNKDTLRLYRKLGFFLISDAKGEMVNYQLILFKQAYVLDVLQAAGITKANFWRYLQTKDEVVLDQFFLDNSEIVAYRFMRNDQFYNILIDINANEIMSYESKSLKLYTSFQDTASEYIVDLFCENKDASSFNARVFFDANDKKENCEIIVNPGENKKISFSLPKINRPNSYKFRLLINNEELCLGKIINPVPVVEMEVKPLQTIYPCKKNEILIRLNNQSSQAFDCSIIISSDSHLINLLTGQNAFCLPANSCETKKAEFICTKKGIYLMTLKVVNSKNGEALANENVVVGCYCPGGNVYYESSDDLFIENDCFMFTFNKKTELSSLMSKASDYRKIELLPENIGPPYQIYAGRGFIPLLRDFKLLRSNIFREDEFIVCELIYFWRQNQDIILKKSYKFSSGSLIPVELSLLAPPPKEFNKEIIVGQSLNCCPGDKFVFADKENIIADYVQKADFPKKDDFYFLNDELLNEDWLALSGNHFLTGMIWDKNGKIKIMGDLHGITTILTFSTAKMIDNVTGVFARFFIYFGEGSFSNIRNHWVALDKGNVPANLPIHRRFMLLCNPNPIVVENGKSCFKLSVKWFDRSFLCGKITIISPQGLEFMPNEFDFGCDETNNFENEVEVFSKSKLPNLFLMQVNASTDKFNAIYRFPVVQIGEQNSLCEYNDKQGEIILRNNQVSAKIVPGFGGAATSLKFFGKELLNTSFPVLRAKGYCPKNFGGIYLRLFDGDQEYTLDSYCYSGTSRGRWRNLPYESLSISGATKNGLAVDIDYSLLAGVNIFPISFVVRNPTPRTILFNYEFSLQVASEINQILYYNNSGEVYNYKPNKFVKEFLSSQWVACECENAAVAMMGDESLLLGRNQGADGLILIAKDVIELLPGDLKKVTIQIVVANNLRSLLQHKEIFSN